MHCLHEHLRDVSSVIRVRRVWVERRLQARNDSQKKLCLAVNGLCEEPVAHSLGLLALDHDFDDPLGALPDPEEERARSALVLGLAVTVAFRGPGALDLRFVLGLDEGRKLRVANHGRKHCPTCSSEPLASQAEGKRNAREPRHPRVHGHGPRSALQDVLDERGHGGGHGGLLERRAPPAERCCVPPLVPPLGLPSGYGIQHLVHQLRLLGRRQPP
mmetsp:Transcript_26732/g.77813  ORF Transcript_26732/g.77813 Transcript_26732/m.77813 type:complete len:216 (-) Transcript_26732:1223-1870(-)